MASKLSAEHMYSSGNNTKAISRQWEWDEAIRAHRFLDAKTDSYVYEDDSVIAVAGEFVNCIKGIQPSKALKLGLFYQSQKSSGSEFIQDNFLVPSSSPGPENTEKVSDLVQPLEIFEMFDQVMQTLKTDADARSSTEAWQDELGRFRMFSNSWNELASQSDIRRGDLNYGMFLDSILTDLESISEELQEVLVVLRGERPAMCDGSMSRYGSDEVQIRTDQIHEATESVNRTVTDLRGQLVTSREDNPSLQNIESRLISIRALEQHIDLAHDGLKLSDGSALARLAVSASGTDALCPVCEKPVKEITIVKSAVHSSISAAPPRTLAQVARQDQS